MSWSLDDLSKNGEKWDDLSEARYLTLLKERAHALKEATLEARRIDKEDAEEKAKTTKVIEKKFKQMSPNKTKDSPLSAKQEQQLEFDRLNQRLLRHTSVFSLEAKRAQLALIAEDD